MLPRSFQRLVRVTSNTGLSVPVALVLDGVTFDTNARGQPLRANAGFRPNTIEAGGFDVATAKRIVSFSRADLALLPRQLDDGDEIVLDGETFVIDEISQPAFDKIDVGYVSRR